MSVGFCQEASRLHYTIGNAYILSNWNHLKIPPLQLIPSSPNSAKMVSDCSPYSSLSASYYTCYGTTGPYAPGYNITSQKYPGSNQTVQGNMDALKACCKSPITNVDPETYGTCYSKCETTGKEQALEVSWCLGNYTEKRPETFFASMGCETTGSGTKMLGRTSSWGGLVMLSLVVSATATIM